MNPEAAPVRFCSQCGQPKSESELARFGDLAVCADCKPGYLQRLREGLAPVTSVVYAGFWQRFLAAFIDGILIGIVSLVLQSVLLGSVAQSTDPSANVGMVGLVYLLTFAIGSSYEAFFLHRAGATPGKMVLGLRVIRPDGSGVSLARGYGRYFSKLISSMILFIGYLMAAFDSQKRALHDMIVDTRVIRART